MNLLAYSLTHLIAIFIIGLCLGSFANVIIYRLPRGISILKPASFCTNCNSPIKWFDNIPLLSYFLLGGKCRYCHTKISVQYPIVEFLTAASILVFYLKFSYNMKLFVIYSIFIFILILISIIDLQHSIIPDVLSIPLAAVGILSSPLNSQLDMDIISKFSPLHHFTPSSLHLFISSSFHRSLSASLHRSLSAFSGAIFGFLIMLFIAMLGKKIFNKEALGSGDIKLAAALGAFLGIEKLTIAMFLGSLVGTISALILIFGLKKKSWGSYLPFGPFLSAGALLTALSFF